MKPDMGATDRTIRIILAAVIAVLYFTGILEGTSGIILMVLAAIVLLTGFMSFCPLYWPFGISTRDQ